MASDVEDLWICSLLGLFDLSTASDTVDHDTSLSRPTVSIWLTFFLFICKAQINARLNPEPAGIIQGFSEVSYSFYADDIYLYVYHFLLYFIVIFHSFYLFYTIFCQALYNFISVTSAFINKLYLLIYYIRAKATYCFVSFLCFNSNFRCTNYPIISVNALIEGTLFLFKLA